MSFIGLHGAGGLDLLATIMLSAGCDTQGTRHADAGVAENIARSFRRGHISYDDDTTLATSSGSLGSLEVL